MKKCFVLFFAILFLGSAVIHAQEITSGSFEKIREKFKTWVDKRYSDWGQIFGFGWGTGYFYKPVFLKLRNRKINFNWIAYADEEGFIYLEIMGSSLPDKILARLTHCRAKLTNSSTILVFPDDWTKAEDMEWPNIVLKRVLAQLKNAGIKAKVSGHVAEAKKRPPGQQPRAEVCRGSSVAEQFFRKE